MYALKKMQSFGNTVFPVCFFKTRNTQNFTILNDDDTNNNDNNNNAMLCRNIKKPRKNYLISCKLVETQVRTICFESESECYWA